MLAFMVAMTLSPDNSRAGTMEGQAFRSEGNGSVPCSGPQAEFLERTAGKIASAVPSATDGVETVHLCAFASTGLPLHRHSVMIFPGAINNPVRYVSQANRRPGRALGPSLI